MLVEQDWKAEVERSSETLCRLTEKISGRIKLQFERRRAEVPGGLGGPVTHLRHGISLDKDDVYPRPSPRGSRGAGAIRTPSDLQVPPLFFFRIVAWYGLKSSV